MSNYAEIKAMYEREKDPAKKAKLKEMLECVEEAARNRRIKPEDWKQH